MTPTDSTNDTLGNNTRLKNSSRKTFNEFFQALSQ